MLRQVVCNYLFPNARQTKKTRRRSEEDNGATKRRRTRGLATRGSCSEERPGIGLAENRRRKNDEGGRFLVKLKRLRRFRMRGSASYYYPTHSKQMNHAPKWPTEFRRHVASTRTQTERVYTRAHARLVDDRPTDRPARPKERRLHVASRNFARAKQLGTAAAPPERSVNPSAAT